MKVGNLVNGLAVVDVKRITSLNLTAFTRDIVKYLDEGYRIDVSSTREVGLQKRVDMFKVEDNKKDVEVKVTVGKTELVEEKSTDTLTEGSLSGNEKYDQKDLVVKVNGEVIETDDSEVPVKKPTQRTKKTT